jgi:D-alanine-D-alanine ligase
MDKPRTKDVYRGAALATPDSLEVDRELWSSAPARVIGRVEETLGLPCVVKTPRLGSSVGVAIAGDREALASTLAEILPLAGRAMVERFVRGTELTAPVLEDPDTGAAAALPLVEIRPRVSGWFDYRAKYEKGGSDELCPAPVPADLTRRVQDIGLTAHRVLGCRGMSRTDVIVDAAGTPWAIETNTIPGFTPTSLLPQAAAAVGISYPDLVDRLIRRALRRDHDSTHQK